MPRGPEPSGPKETEAAASVPEWSGFVMVDAEGQVVVYKSGTPKLYTTESQAEFSLQIRAGLRLIPLTIPRQAPAP